MSSIIRTEKVRRSFPIGNREMLEVLKGIDFEAEEGALTILKGRSGSGKTTLLNILSLLDDPTSGKVIIESRDMHSLSLSHES